MFRHRWTIIAIIYFAAVLVANLLNTSGANLTGLFALVPVLLSLEWGPGVVALGSLPLVGLAATDLMHGSSVSTTVVRTTGVAVGVGIGAYSASYRLRYATRLDLSRAAAVAAQEAILPAVPESLGRYRFACAYRTAVQESLVGGDLYKVIQTDCGIRLLIGDVRGKGLAALAMTSAVLGCFREWAPETSTLKHLVARLDARVVDKAAPGDFVTAIVASFDDDLVVEVANCGHPSPIHLLAGGPKNAIVPERRATPLGLDPEVTVSTIEMAPGDRLFFYTDGLIEARDRSGTWIELDETLLSTLYSDSPHDALARLLARFDERVPQLRDDMALLLVECTE
jgi:serine phosphatase RsbU (regulator of sigma subunit)